MRFQIEQHLPGPLEAVEAALFDPDFLVRLGTLPKLGAPALLDRNDDGTTTTQRVRYAFTGDLGPAVTRFIRPERLTWVEEVVADRRTHRATHTIHPDHYASMLACHYTTTLTEQGPDVCRVAAGDLAVHIPFVGGKAERAIVAGLAEHAELEAAALRDWLLERQ